MWGGRGGDSATPNLPTSTARSRVCQQAYVAQITCELLGGHPSLDLPFNTRIHTLLNAWPGNKPTPSLPEQITPTSPSTCQWVARTLSPPPLSQPPAWRQRGTKPSLESGEPAARCFSALPPSPCRRTPLGFRGRTSLTEQTVYTWSRGWSIGGGGGISFALLGMKNQKQRGAFSCIPSFYQGMPMFKCGWVRLVGLRRKTPLWIGVGLETSM